MSTASQIVGIHLWEEPLLNLADTRMGGAGLVQIMEQQASSLVHAGQYSQPSTHFKSWFALICGIYHRAAAVPKFVYYSQADCVHTGNSLAKPSSTLHSFWASGHRHEAGAP